MALIFSFLMVNSSEIWANECRGYFKNISESEAVNRDPLSDLIRLEERTKKLDSVRVTIKNSLENLSKADQILYETKNTIDLLITKLESDPNETILREIDRLNATLDKVDRFFQIQQLRKSNPKYVDVVNDPKIMLPDHLYEINGLDPSVKRVLFSREVAENIFWSDNPLYERAANLIFRALHKGRKNNSETTGIFTFINDKSVYKVKINGTNVGAIRVAGYFLGSDFHIVAYSHESSHGEAASSKLTESVNRIRYERGH